MTKKEIQKTENILPAQLEQVLIKGDLSSLNDAQKLQYYHAVCTSVGLNPLTKPFEFLKLNGRTVLYALKGATDQLRSVHSISISEPKIQNIDDIIFVSVTAIDRTGRTDADTGAVTIGNLKGDAKCNAVMKAITKAKRRVTLSMCGLGMLDETEIETIPDARPAPINVTQGMPEVTVEPLNLAYDFESLEYDNKMKAYELATKQGAIKVEDVDDPALVIFTSTKYLEPRKNFDKFIIQEGLNQKK